MAFAVSATTGRVYLRSIEVGYHECVDGLHRFFEVSEKNMFRYAGHSRAGFGGEGKTLQLCQGGVYRVYVFCL